MYIYISHVNVTQTVPDISPLMPMHQDPLLVAAADVPTAGIARSSITLMLTMWTWWRHQMATFPRYWPFVRGIHRSPVNSPHKGHWRGALMFSLIYARTKQSRRRWFETPSRSLWRHCNEWPHWSTSWVNFDLWRNNGEWYQKQILKTKRHIKG